MLDRAQWRRGVLLSAAGGMDGHLVRARVPARESGGTRGMS